MALFLFLFLINPSFSDVQDNILYSGETLQTGDQLQLGIYTFIMQAYCNLVQYVKGDDEPIWTSKTGELAMNCYCSLQSDGNLVVYKPNGTPLWASNTGGAQGNYVLILQKDRNVVIYGVAVWATGTNIPSLGSKRGGAGAMDVVSIANLPSSIIYMDGIDLAKNVTSKEKIQQPSISSSVNETQKAKRKQQQPITSSKKSVTGKPTNGVGKRRIPPSA